jgi:hypothetical protein
MKLTEESKRMFFLVCYNIDKFRDFVFNSSFLNRYEILDETIEDIRREDVALLQFGFDWLKASFFHTGHDKFKTKRS